jgi:hypothetical protein
MEYTERDMSEFVIDTININKQPLKFLELNTTTTLQLLTKGYNVVVKEDKHSLCSLFYSVVFPPKSNFIKNVTRKFKKGKLRNV